MFIFLQRKTVKESDVLEALKEAEFEDLIPLIEKDMEVAKAKKAKKAESKKSKPDSKSPEKSPKADIAVTKEDGEGDMEV
jgi:hypothetical protein